MSRIYVKYPPTDGEHESVDEIRLCVTEDDAFQAAIFNGDPTPSVVAALVDGDIKEFEDTGSPIAAIRAMVMCNAAGVFPPASIQKWVSNALYELHESDGNANLRTLLGLAGKRGIKDAYGLYNQRADSENYATFVHWLVVKFNISVGKAAFMVHARQEALGKECPSSDWIEEDYKKNWKNKLRDIDTPDFTKEIWDRFLNSFPDYSRLG